VNRPRQATTLALLAVLASVIAGGCGSQGIEVKTRGAMLFHDRCGGCHTLKAAGTRGSVLGERPTGPNLDKRKLAKDDVLFAIRNGGFSGAIMPQNVVVGPDAEAVADFVSKYAGSESKGPPAPAPAGSTQSGVQPGGGGAKVAAKK
jgi:mono/diheme cytochrome c family protein